jgi:hypothetical protein
LDDYYDFKELVLALKDIHATLWRPHNKKNDVKMFSPVDPLMTLHQESCDRPLLETVHREVASQAECYVLNAHHWPFSLPCPDFSHEF